MTVALTAAGWLDLAATIALAGGLGWAWLVAPVTDAGRTALRAATLALAVVLVLEFGLTAIRMYEVAEVRGVALLVDLVATRWGRLWLARVTGLAVLAVAARRSRPPAGIALLALPWLFLRSLQGHAGAHGTVPALVDAVHLAAAALWVGGLLQLRLARPAAATAARFLTVATAALVLLLPAGVYGALLHVPSIAKLTGTAYGRTLLAKLLLAAILIGVGAGNHFRHVPRLVAGSPDAGPALRRRVGIELVLAAAILLLSALLGVLPMPHGTP